MKKGKKLIIISAIAGVLVISIFGCIFAAFFNKATKNNQIFIHMPRSFICAYFEKNVPIGSSPDTAIEFLLSNKQWTTGGPYIIGTFEVLHDYDYKLRPCGNLRISNTENCYSFNWNNYNRKTIKEASNGEYLIKVDVGLSESMSMWGRHVLVYFIYDESLTLVDIVVKKEFIGY